MSTPSLPSFAPRGCLKPAETWRARLRTGQAMVLLCLARLLVAAVPFRYWRGRLGGRAGDPADSAVARLLAAHIERAARRLPLAIKCLPQAAALSWQLRRRRIGHRLVFAVRPAAVRGAGDGLHAWIECGAAIVLGELPGPWLELPVPDRPSHGKQG